MSLKSSLEYKYRPTVKYEVQLFRSTDGPLGELSVVFRTQSAALIEAMTQFFRLWKRTEDRLLAPLSPSGFDGALVKAGFVGEAWTRATEQEKHRQGNTTELLVTQVPGERPTVVITTPAIGHVPPRPVLMFSCVDNITRMQVALMHPLDVHDIAVTLNADNRALRSHWFVRENGTLLESSRGLSGIDEIKQLFGAKTLTVDTGADNAAGKLTFNIDGLARAIAPLRDACHWAGE